MNVRKYLAPDGVNLAALVVSTALMTLTACGGSPADENLDNLRPMPELGAALAGELQANSDFAETNAGVPVAVSILNNDSFASGVSYQLLGQPANGTAILLDSGAVEYTANVDYEGTDVVEYVLVDEDGTQSFGRLFIAVACADCDFPGQSEGIDPLSGLPFCAGTSDDDGDGYGWENEASCVIPDSVASSDSLAAVTDTVTIESGTLPVAPKANLPVEIEKPLTIEEEGPVKAFPGAKGYGRFASGGRGGAVVIVNTLKDVVSSSDGKTSLREALETMSGARTIVFEVGGVFDLGTSELLMQGSADSNVTVACQTAPAPGVVIKGGGVRIKGGANNIIMRHCKIRNIDPGMPAAEASRALGIVGTTKGVQNMIFDHMSLSWATDENFTVYTGPSSTLDSENFTLSNSIISEGDSNSSHPESGKLPSRYVHAMGPSCNSNSDTYRITGCSILSNFIAHNARRNPLMLAVEGEVQNNLIYNWHEIGAHGFPYVGELDVYLAGNTFKTGPTTRKDQPVIRITGTKSDTRFIQIDNQHIDHDTLAQTSVEDITQGKPSIVPSEADEINMDCVGASRPARDGVDARVIFEYETGTGEVGVGNNHRRDFSEYVDSAHPDSYDTDKDGIEDSWEIAYGLNPNDASDSLGDLDGDGYTNIEEFINALAHCK